MLTGDSWASSVTRGLFRGDNDNEVYKTQYDVAFFFVSYMLLASIMMLNVVVAILLDEFISTVSREKEAEEQLEREKNKLERDRERVCV